MALLEDCHATMCCGVDGSACEVVVEGGGVVGGGGVERCGVLGREVVEEVGVCAVVVLFACVGVGAVVDQSGTGGGGYEQWEGFVLYIFGKRMGEKLFFYV